MTNRPPQLAARFGALDLPYVRLGQGPTPVGRLEALSRELGCDVWVKRDDRSGELYGGNKVRKLEFLLGEAVARKRTRVMTLGAYGTHHGLATAIYARHLGLDCRLALHPQPITAHVLDQIVLHHRVGARLTHMPRPMFMPLTMMLMSVYARSGELVPIGGSSALGALGFVEAGLELGAQVAAGELPAPTRIVVAAGTCGTVAGLALGLELAGLTSEVVAVRVVPAFITNDRLIQHLRDGAWKLLQSAGVPADARSSQVTVTLDPHELGPGYGELTPATTAAVARFADHGVALETTYTGKAAAGLLRAASSWKQETVLFWNTYSSVDAGAHLPEFDPASVQEPWRTVLRDGGRLG